jgi:hypothetical protein
MVIHDDHDDFGGLQRDLLATGVAINRRSLLRMAAPTCASHPSPAAPCVETTDTGRSAIPAIWTSAIFSMAAIRDFAFDQLHRERVVSCIYPDNAASIRVAEKIGMRYEKDFDWAEHTLSLYAMTRDQRPLIAAPASSGVIHAP